MLGSELLLRNIRLRPDKLAVRSESGDVSFAELNRRVNRLAHALIELGIIKGRQVAILAKNSTDYIALYFANMKVGGVTIPLNYRLTPEELRYIISDSKATMLLFDDEYSDVVRRLQPQLPEVKTYILLAGTSPVGSNEKVDSHRASTLMEKSIETEPEVEITDNDLIWQMYTSGTTGRPKGAMISHRNLMANVASGIVDLPIAPGDHYLIPAPLYHGAAVISFAKAFARGAGMTLRRDFDPADILRTIETDRITHVLLIPAMIIFLLNTPEVEKTDFSSLKYVIYGAAPTPIDVLKRALATFGCNFYQAYGQTEAVAILTHLGAEDHDPDGPIAHRLASIGRENYGVEIRVVDGNGRRVGSNQIGEIIARGDNVMRGYWNLPEETARTLKDGWLYTGDLATLDEEGYIYLVDRKKDMIISGGENVYPREVEEVLYAHPDVADAAVIGIPHEQWGETVLAFVVRKPDANVSAKDIENHCRDHLAGFKCPRQVEFINVLPRNPSGKVLKRELRIPYWEGQKRLIH